ncbi:hypothetical protein C4D60_Mb04t21430 [Musa balbisiana]|uniref:Uncharacterized protein n=1 Tax=Musa balbisiana TaxID=52838 RepID=A0A4S8KDM8_MUSBA|nr:hypothetical protein C4D60_Mb04t21430 [Musa balbisiana]
MKHLPCILSGATLVACLDRVVELLENAAGEEISEQLLKEEDDEAQHPHSLNDFGGDDEVAGKLERGVVIDPQKVEERRKMIMVGGGARISSRMSLASYGIDTVTSLLSTM